MSKLEQPPRDGSQETPPRVLPDIAEDTTAHVQGCLQKVGMSGIEVGLRLRDPQGRTVLVPARADAYLSLDDPTAKGIHMSRLFVHLQSALDEEEFHLQMAAELLRRFLASHAGLSRSSYLAFHFDYLMRRSALTSGHSAWRSYPVRVASQLEDGVLSHRLHVRTTYSSACPCSAALSRQLLQEQFTEAFGEQEFVSAEDVKYWLGTGEATTAVPHSQRSHADVTVVLTDEQSGLPLGELIDTIESALLTPVQTVVKRADEQEFARLNGKHLMFCEDAARRIKAALEAMPHISDYRIEANHLESLHPHDAVAVVTKGLPGGLQP